MEKYTLTENIHVCCVTAASYPEGIMESHRRLHSLIPFSTQRRYFGLSRPENEKGIVYRAAAEELEKGEGEKLGCEPFVIPKGEYISITLHNYLDDLTSIGKAFDQLTDYPGIDPQGYCVEWYLDEKNVRCMIRLA
jgi:hypothetical protein